jgi:hypothetical protein
MTRGTNRRAANAAARTRLVDCRSNRGERNEPDQRPQEAIAAVAVVAAHIRKRGPLPGCQHVFEQMLAVDIEHPGLSFCDFVVACAVASAEGEA